MLDAVMADIDSAPVNKRIKTIFRFLKQGDQNTRFPNCPGHKEASAFSWGFSFGLICEFSEQDLLRGATEWNLQSI